MGLFVRLLICVAFTGFILYRYIDKLNDLTELKMAIPAAEKELREIKEKNVELRYSIEQFENPIHLMELASQPEFGHFEYPSLDEVILLPDAAHKENE